MLEYRIAGKVVLADGKPVPDSARMYIGRRDASDSLPVDLADDASFAVSGVPAEEISIEVLVKGYRFSVRNKSYNLEDGRFKGQVTHDIDQLIILLEPRDPAANVRPQSNPERPDRGDLPLEGIPAAAAPEAHPNAPEN
jgi:hypothetical protein